MRLTLKDNLKDNDPTQNLLRCQSVKPNCTANCQLLPLVANKPYKRLMGRYLIEINKKKKSVNE